MLIALNDSAAVTAAQRALTARLSGVLTRQRGPYVLGYQGGRNVAPAVFRNADIWYYGRRYTESPIHPYWNAFGEADSLTRSRSNSIAVEINIPLAGKARGVAGLFARNSDTGEVALLHRGNVGGGRRHIGKASFLNWTDRPRVSVFDSPTSPSSETALLVATLDSSSFATDIAAFVRSAAAFKQRAQEAEMRALSDAALLQRARSSGRVKPKRVSTEGQVFERSVFVAAYTKRRAAGLCELCGSPAPFRNSDGDPFLECHHIVWLARDGPDTVENAVAVCPNCHRKMHVLALPEDVNKLVLKASPPRTPSNDR